MREPWSFGWRLAFCIAILSPALAFQMKIRRGQKLAQLRTAALGALAWRVCSQFLQHIEFMAAGIAFVGEDWHFLWLRRIYRATIKEQLTRSSNSVISRFVSVGSTPGTTSTLACSASAARTSALTSPAAIVLNE